jgi:hypothetical protein
MKKFNVYYTSSTGRERYLLITAKNEKQAKEIAAKKITNIIRVEESKGFYAF